MKQPSENASVENGRVSLQRSSWLLTTFGEINERAEDGRRTQSGNQEIQPVSFGARSRSTLEAIVSKRNEFEVLEGSSDEELTGARGSQKQSRPGPSKKSGLESGWVVWRNQRRTVAQYHSAQRRAEARSSFSAQPGPAASQ